MGMEKWWGPVSSHTSMCEETRPPSPCSIFTSSFLPSFLPPPTDLITSGLRRTTVQCQEQSRQEGGYWFWRQKGQWAWSPQVLAGPVLQSQMPPLLLSSLALPLTLHPRLQRFPQAWSVTRQVYLDSSPGMAFTHVHFCKRVSCLEAPPRWGGSQLSSMCSVSWVGSSSSAAIQTYISRGKFT